MIGDDKNQYILRSMNGDIEIAIDGVVTIGRSSKCSLVLNDERVSGRHAMLRFEEDKIIIKDLNSTNQTWVNDVDIKPSEDVLLFAGDIVSIGNHTFTLIFEEKEETEIKGKTKLTGLKDPGINFELPELPSGQIEEGSTYDTAALEHNTQGLENELTRLKEHSKKLQEAKVEKKERSAKLKQFQEKRKKLLEVVDAEMLDDKDSLMAELKVVQRQMEALKKAQAHLENKLKMIHEFEDVDRELTSLIGDDLPENLTGEITQVDVRIQKLQKELDVAQEIIRNKKQEKRKYMRKKQIEQKKQILESIKDLQNRLKKMPD